MNKKETIETVTAILVMTALVSLFIYFMMKIITTDQVGPIFYPW